MFSWRVFARVLLLVEVDACTAGNQLPLLILLYRVFLLYLHRFVFSLQVKRTTKVKVFTERTRVHKSCLERTKWNKFGLAAQVHILYLFFF